MKTTFFSQSAGIRCGLLVAIFICQLVAAQIGNSQDSNPGPTRKLQFPSDHQVGVVLVGRFAGPTVLLGFEQEHAYAALSTLTVPADRFVELRVGSVDDLSFLDRLPADGLHGLNIRGLRIDKPAVAIITRLQSLRSLVLADCQIEDDAFEGAAALPELQALSIQAKENLAGHNLSLAKWASELPKLDYFYAQPALNAYALKHLDGHPTLRTTNISIDQDRQALAFKLIKLPQLTELIVTVGEGVSPRSLDRIAAVANLQSLTISRGTVDGELLRSIADIGTVRKLRLIFNKIGDDFLDGLAEFTSLEHLEMNPNSLDWDGEREFYRQMPQVLLKLPNIKSFPRIDRPTADTLQQIVDRTTIEVLEINGWDRNVPLAALQDLKKLHHLRTLKLSSVPISDDDLQAFSGATELQELSLVHTQVHGHGLAHLARLPKLREMLIMADAHRIAPDLSGLQHLPHLERLQILGLGFAPEQLSPIAECKALKDVALTEGEIDDMLLQRIAKLPHLARISVSADMTDTGARALARNQQLESVVIRGNITTETIEEYAKLPRLRRFFVRSPLLSTEDLERLPSSFPAVASIGFSK